MYVWLVALIVGASCLVVAPRLRARESARDARAVAAQNVLPPACVSFLKDERCWLRSLNGADPRAGGV
jgi:hypothetical protein